VTNSTCFSPDGTIMYHTDTFTKVINAYPYDQATGVVSEAIPYYRTKEGLGKYLPDGSCVNSAGQVWNSQYFGK